jgi:hypothetical protein
MVMIAANELNTVTLSSHDHYYYDSEELKNVNTVIYLKELYQVREIKSFLQSIFDILPQNSNFTGCFADNSRVNGFELRAKQSVSEIEESYDNPENGIVSQISFINMIYSIMDSKTNKYLSEKSVTEMLKGNGFRILNKKVISGVTCFHSQKIDSTPK